MLENFLLIDFLYLKIELIYTELFYSEDFLIASFTETSGPKEKSWEHWLVWHQDICI